MFQVPHDSPLAAALLTHTVPDEEAVSHLGRAVHVGCAKRALLEAAPLLPTSRHVRYASACSGIDTVAAGMSAIFPQGWEYVFASEHNALASKVLVRAWSSHGLRPEWVFEDAASREATADAPAVDLWVITPPCPDYSRRNRHRSPAGVLRATSELDQMLEYARLRRPTTIVVENVDEPEARAAITAALLSVQGYTWVTFGSDASEYGSMVRERRFWVGSSA